MLDTMSSAARPSPLATASDLLAVRDDRRVEVIGGVIVEKAAPSYEHGDAQSSLAELLKPPFQRGRGGPGGWWIATEVEIELETHEVYRPDLVGWRRERVPERPRGRPIRARPDWVSEILSVSNAEIDLGKKLLAYHRAGIPHYWIVDPEHETVTVYRQSSEGYVVVLTAGRADSVRAPPFGDIELRIAELFGE
jgi:Uma2 family endonuclease